MFACVCVRAYVCVRVVDFEFVPHERAEVGYTVLYVPGNKPFGRLWHIL